MLAIHSIFAALSVGLAPLLVNCRSTWLPTKDAVRACAPKDAVPGRRREPEDDVNLADMVFDHIDLRVTEVAAARPFYDVFLRAFGFRRQTQASGDIVYYRFADRRVQEAVALIEAAGHIANRVRLAFHAESPEDVDRIAAIARNAGARAFEAPQWCPEIADRYYAAFFEDPSGNRLEVVSR